RDHTFSTRRTVEPTEALLAMKVFESFSHPARIVVVAAAGGGIQAAGWTARVLEGIVAATPPQKLDQLLASIVVVSGVSGGSVGLAPFVAAMHAGARPGGRTTRETLIAALRKAADSSLDPVAASFATSDLIPLIAFPDRGA